MSTKGVQTSPKYLPVFISLAAAALFSIPMLLKWDYIGVGDWELFCTVAAVPVKSLLQYGQFPAWNPYIGGGNILFAHPEVSVISPFFLLHLVFGAINGLKLQVLIVWFLGFLGTYKLAGKIGLSDAASYLVSFVYFGSSYFALHFSIGHIPFTHFCFLPWFMFFVLKTAENWKYFFGAAVSIALIILGNGAAIPFLYTAFFSGVIFAIMAIEGRSLKLIKVYVLSILSGVLLASVKFIPMFYYLSINRWEGMPEDATPFSLALKGFFSFNQEIFRVSTPQQWGWHEYGAYTSPLILLIAVYGLFRAFKKCRVWLIAGLFFFLFGLGNFSVISPWNIFTHLPGFESVRAPSRAFQFVVLGMGVMAGFGLDAVIDKYKDIIPRIRLLSIVLIAAVLLGNFGINLPSLNTAGYKKPDKAKTAGEFRQVIGRKDNIYNQFQQNRGSLVAPWLSGYKESRGLVTPTNDVLMEYIFAGSGEVITRDYTPNRVVYEIKPVSDGSMVFGIGYDEGWSTADNRPVYEYNGLVALDFSQADREIILEYNVPYLYTGMIISLLTCLAMILALTLRQFGDRLEAVFK